MRAEHRLVLSVLLAALVAGCTAVGGAAPPTLAQLELPDRYAALAFDGGPLQPAALDRCWSWLDDSQLAALLDRPLSAQARAAIADRYIALRARQAQVADARAYLDAQLDNLEIARFREEAGLVTPRDAVQADAERARIAASISNIEAGIAADSARIATLIGQSPAVLVDQLNPPGPIPIEPAEVGVGLPSDLADRRADLRKAGGRLRTVSLLGPSQALAAYKRAMLAALEDVENARSAFYGAVLGARGLAVAEEKAQALAELARQQYRDGRADFGALSSAETALLTTRDALADARAARGQASIRLCVALGGGGSPAAGPGG